MSIEGGDGRPSHYDAVTRIACSLTALDALASSGVSATLPDEPRQRQPVSLPGIIVAPVHVDHSRRGLARPSTSRFMISLTTSTNTRDLSGGVAPAVCANTA